MFWHKIRSSIMFFIALVACPCHLPITMPLILLLLAGTSTSVWLTRHVGWVYGALAGIFLLSLVLGFRWMRYASIIRDARKIRVYRKA
jgi:hypothetical protein